MNHSILLIDDEVETARALGDFLSEQGYRVNYAVNGDEALTKVFDADLVLCDLRLGSENGLSVIERLRARRPNLKVLVLTAYPSIEALQHGADLGVTDFLTKPLGLPEAVAVIDRFFGMEIGGVLLFPPTLQEKLGEAARYLGTVTPIELGRWAEIRNQLKPDETSCVLVDIGAPDATRFLDLWRREMDGIPLFLVCREQDFNLARRLITEVPAARFLSMEMSPGQLVKEIRNQISARRRITEDVREALTERFGRCVHARPIRGGYYCTLSRLCPFGEEKVSVLSLKGKDFHRCPKRPFLVSNPERIGLLTWWGQPREDEAIQFRTEAIDLVGYGRSHIVINCQGLEALHPNLIEVLADVKAQLVKKQTWRLDVINLQPNLLAALRKEEHLLGGAQLHGPVMIEIEGYTPIMTATGDGQGSAAVPRDSHAVIDGA